MIYRISGIDATDGEPLELIANIREDDIRIDHEEDEVCKFTTVWVNSDDICVRTDSFKFEQIK